MRFPNGAAAAAVARTLLSLGTAGVTVGPDAAGVA